MPVDRMREIVNLFGLPRSRRRPRRPVIARTTLRQIIPAPGQITLITGPSGAGKSSLLRAAGTLLRSCEVIDLDLLKVPDRPIVELFPRLALDRALLHLGRFGLAEAWTYLRTPSQLSAGQLWRVRLALATERASRARASAGPIVISDEFTSLLDRVTAAVIARSLRRVITPPLRAMVATSHDDLAGALQADKVVECDFGAAAAPVVRLRGS